MGMRYDFWQGERERATLLDNGQKVLKTEALGRFELQMWMPKALKPFANYTFKTEEARGKYIADAIANFAAHQARKLEYRLARSTGDASLADPGAVFCYSWGYDQTNVEYFQVIERRGLAVTIAAIGQEVVRGSEGFMCESVRPKIDGFLQRCAMCRDSEHALCHGEHIPEEAKQRYGCECRAYRPERILHTKRLQFSGGEPMLSFDHGIGKLVPVVRFGNAAPLAVSSHYQSHYA